MTGRGSTQSAGEVVGHLGPAVCCYLGFLAAAACGQWLARTPGVTITFWPPNGVMLASLLLVGRPVWPSLLAAGFCAELTSNALWFGNSLPMASIYYAVNATECLVAAWLLRSFFPLPARLRTLRQVLALIVLGVGVAPIVGATLGSLVDLAIGKHAFMQAWPLWWIGDAAGTMIAMPLTLVVVEIWMDRPHLSRGEIMEAIIVGGVLLTIGVLALDTYLPFAYIIMPPLLWASVRFNFAGAVFSSAGLAAMVAVFATVGAPQFGGDTISQGHKHVMMQLFVAVSTLTSLVVAAISQQHRQILFSLRNANDRLEARVEERTAALGESEARLRAFYETAPVCMGVTEPWDDDVLQIYDNPASCMIFGVEPGATAGKWAHRDLGINPHLIRSWLGKYRVSEASGLPQQFEQAVGDRDDRRWMSVTICPIGSSPEGRTRFCYVAEDITARKRTEQALTETAHSLARERERLAIALRTGRLGVYEWRVGDEAIWWSEEVYAVYGVDPDTFSPTIQSFEQLVHPDDRAELWRKSEICIEERAVFEHEYRIIAPDGQIRWIANRSQVGLGADGTVERITGVAVDVTERKIAEEQTQLLLREVNHRAKNMLGLVQAIARQTAAAGSAEFAQRFAERVQALAASQDVLVKSGWKDVSLEELARAQLGHFGDAVGDRILLAGPELRISAAAAQAIGMALHELATNAAKYGALAIASGRIAIDWGVQGGASGAPAFYMTWIESDGPPVAVPERLGFGSTVIGTMIRMSLDCEATIDYAPSGLKWRMEADVRKLLDGASEAFARTDAGPPTPGAAPLKVQASA